MTRVRDAQSWRTFVKAYKETGQVAPAARRAGMNYQTGRDFVNRKPTSSGARFFHLLDAEGALGSFDIGPIPLDKLGEEATRALSDFPYFRLRYFGNICTPWQNEYALKVVELLESPNDEFLLVNAPPGSGKSTFINDLAAWVTVKDRAIRGLFGSSSQALANKMCSRLKRDLERTIPSAAKTKELAAGVAQDAAATLWQDFGRFKPQKSERWAAEEFVVDQFGGVSIDEKESTWTAYGKESAQLGNRYEFIVWDDLVSDKNMRSLNTRQELFDWYEQTAESRLEPGGLLLLNGQRISSVDLYRHCLDMRDEDERQVYTHIVFKAHDDLKCSGEHEGLKPWPESCLLDPHRLNWPKLSKLRRNNKNLYAVTYQQEDSDPEDVLVNPLWLTGGMDNDRILYPGCWDKGRKLWELPKGVADPIGIASFDPSPTRYWACLAFVYVPQIDTANPVEGMGGYRYLMDAENKTMDADGLLDYNFADRMWYGMLEDWWQLYKEMGVPLSYVIVENNAAQRFLLQYDHARRWSTARNVQFVPHSTHYKNKLDETLGIPIIAPHYKFGRYRLPGHESARIKFNPLRHQITHWTQTYSGADDQVMANWFLEANLPNLWTPPSNAKPQPRPSWLRRR